MRIIHKYKGDPSGGHEMIVFAAHDGVWAVLSDGFDYGSSMTIYPIPADGLEALLACPNSWEAGELLRAKYEALPGPVA